MISKVAQDEQTIKKSKLADLKKLGAITTAKRKKVKQPKDDGPARPSLIIGTLTGPVLRRAKNIRDLVIEPQQFTVDKILMLLDIKKLKRLG